MSKSLLQSKYFDIPVGELIEKLCSELSPTGKPGSQKRARGQNSLYIVQVYPCRNKQGVLFLRSDIYPK